MSTKRFRADMDLMNSFSTLKNSERSTTRGSIADRSANVSESAQKGTDSRQCYYLVKHKIDINVLTLYVRYRIDANATIVRTRNSMVEESSGFFIDARQDLTERDFDAVLEIQRTEERRIKETKLNHQRHGHG